MMNTAKAIAGHDSARKTVACIQAVDVSLLPGSAGIEGWVEDNVAEQMSMVRQYALTAAIDIDGFIRVPLPFSFKKRLKRPVFESAFRVGKITTGAGCLMVSDISRLGMNRPEIVYTVQEMIVKKNIRLIVCDSDICIVPGETKGSTNVKLYTALKNVEEILDARRESIKRAIGKGSSCSRGRPKGSLSSALDRKRGEIRYYLTLGYTREKISRILGVSRSALDYVIRTRALS